MEPFVATLWLILLFPRRLYCITRERNCQIAKVIDII